MADRRVPAAALLTGPERRVGVDGVLPGQARLPGVDVPPSLVDEHGQPFVTIIWEKAKVVGWPEKGDHASGTATRRSLAYALKNRWDCDAHITGYSAPPVTVQTAHGPRLTSELRLNKGAVVPGGFTMELAIFDVDGPWHDHKATIQRAKDRIEAAIAKGDTAARDEAAAGLLALEAKSPQVKIDHEAWWQVEREKVTRIYELHGPAAYRTGGGYRLLGRIDSPMLIGGPDDRATWERQYCTWAAYLKLTYGIDVDIACAYSECLFRLPFVRRDGKDEKPETHGNADEAYWCFEAEVDLELAHAEAVRLWPSKMLRTAHHSGGGRETIKADPMELRQRWESFSEQEKQRRIGLYVDDLHHGLEPSKKDVDGHATRLVAARSGVVGFGIGDLELVMDLMIEHWVPRCDHTWARTDLAHKVEDAAKSTTREMDYNMPEVRERERQAFIDAAFPQSRTNGTNTTSNGTNTSNGGDTTSNGTNTSNGDDTTNTGTNTSGDDDEPAVIRTEPWNGEVFANRYHSRFRFLVDREVWLWWDGCRWSDAVEGELVRCAEQVIQEFFELAATFEPDSTKGRAWWSWALKSYTKDGITKMIYFASTDPRMAARRSQFDTHLHLLNVANGTIDLRNGELRQHAKQDYLTTITPIKYDPAAKCPRWHQFLREIFVKVGENGAVIFKDDRPEPDEELIAYVTHGVGYSMTGYTREHAFFILYGIGRNGKGRFIRQLMALLGDAAKTTKFQTLTASGTNEGGNTPSLASLAGARLVTAGEPDEGVSFSESLIKTITGEDEIEVCAKFESPFRYIPRFKVWLHANHRPRIKGTDEGVWSRPRLIPFNVRFDNIDGKGTDARDFQLDGKLDAEQSGILGWAVAAAIDWFRGGLGKAAAVMTATDDYRHEQDTVGGFIDECLHVGPRKSISSSRLHKLYTDWCKDHGDKFPLSLAGIKARLDGKKIPTDVEEVVVRYKHRRDWRGYHGIGEAFSNSDDPKLKGAQP